MTRPALRATAADGVLREFRRPALWTAIWLVALATIAVVCLRPVPEWVPQGFVGIDKLEHFLAYLALSAYAVMLFARPRTQALAGLGLIVFGVAIELAQGAFTARTADLGDALANALGVWLGLASASTRAASLLQCVDRWLRR
ncbi:MAG: VanZ family protein [Luteimonas sp.]